MLDRTGSEPQTEENPCGGEEDREVLTDVHAAEVNELLACFKRYWLRSKVEIDNVSDEFLCWQRFGTDMAHAEPSTQEQRLSPDEDKVVKMAEISPHEFVHWMGQAS